MLGDLHTHMKLDPKSLKVDLKYLKRYKEEFDRANLDYAVVMILPSVITKDGFGEYQFDRDNKKNLELMKQENIALGEFCMDKPELIPFAWLDYEMEDAVDFLDLLIKDYGFRGLKIHQVFNGKANDDYHPLVLKAISKRCPIMVHTGFRFPASVEWVGELAGEFPAGTYIVAHLIEEYGLNKKHSFVDLAQKYDNIYFELSFIQSKGRLDDFVKGTKENPDYKIGDERILFGSDFPMGHRDIAYSQLIVTYARISDQAKKNILGDNMARIFGLGENFSNKTKY